VGADERASLKFAPRALVFPFQTLGGRKTWGRTKLFHLPGDPFRVRAVTLRDIFYRGIAARQKPASKFVTVRTRETARISHESRILPVSLALTAAVRSDDAKRAGD